MIIIIDITDVGQQTSKNMCISSYVVSSISISWLVLWLDIRVTTIVGCRLGIGLALTLAVFSIQLTTNNLTAPFKDFITVPLQDAGVTHNQ